MKKITFILITLMCTISNAQWSSDTAQNLLVVNDSSDDAISISTTDGKTYVVYWKAVGSSTNFELRLQVLDSLGNKQLGVDGILVSNTIPMSTFTLTWQLAVDFNNNLLIGVTGSGDYQGYAFKLDSNGNHLWNANGINTNGTGFSVTFLPLSTGETIINWDADNQALMQKYDASGNAIWSTPQPIVLGTSKTSPASLYELSNGDFMAIFHKKANFGTSSTLYAQRYDSTGTSVWSNAVQLSNNSTVFNKLYSGTQDGDVVYIGYSSSANNRFDSYLQRINPDGTLPWGINGVDFDTNQTNFEQNTEIAYSNNSQYVWSICKYTNTAQSEHGEYIQKFDKDTGARQFTNNAKELFAISTALVSHASSLRLVNDNPVFLINYGTDIKITLVDGNGDFIWSEISKPIGTFNASKSRIILNKPINGQLVTTFIENKTGTNQIFAQNFQDPALLGVSKFDISNAIQFANPIGNNLHITSDYGIKSVTIYNVLGKLIYHQKLENQTQIEINTKEWKSGLYFINLRCEGDFNYSKKIIKEN